MKHKKLKIGRIPYANLFPIFHYLDTRCTGRRYHYVHGVPSKLNVLLRSGELDVSPSSSIEFLMNRDEYRILPWHSISSTGPIKSILLFSSVPIEELGGRTIAVTSDSATSVVLLKIILREFLSIECPLTPTGLRSVRNILASFPAVLHIGDTAMLEAKKVFTDDKCAGKGKRASTVRNPRLFVYDLGELWHTYTGLPFVYALWVVREKSLHEKTDLIKELSLDLINAKKHAHRKLSVIAKEAPQKKWLGEKDLVRYWKSISYDFTGQHLEGLQLFEKYALKIRQ